MAPNSVRSLDVAATDSTIVAATAAATSITELTLTVPHAWRSAVAPHLNAVYRVAAKMCTVQNTIAHYERHKAEGSFPPAILNSIKDPKIQFSKEYLGTETGSLAQGSFIHAVQQARKTLLDCATAQKREELAALQKLVTFEEATWRKLVLEALARAAVTFGVVLPDAPVTATAPPDWGTVAPKHLKEETAMMWKHGNVFHFRAVSLARALADRSLLEKTRNLSIKKQTDTAMKDADLELTTREVVRDELRSELAQFKQQMAGLMGNSRKSAQTRKGKGGSSPSKKSTSRVTKRAGGKKKKAKK